MTHDQTSASVASDEPWIGQLIPGEDVLLVLTPEAAVPDEEALEELQIQAYERRNAPTMGTHETVQAVETIAEWVASGMLTSFGSALFPATWQFVQKLVRAGGKRINVQDAIDAARRLCPKALGRQPTVFEIVQSVPLTHGWHIDTLVDGIQYQFIIDSTGSVASFRRMTPP